MSTFKVGEIAILTFSNLLPELQGEEVEIITLARVCHPKNRANPGIYYKIKIKDGRKFNTPPEHLKKKPPPPDVVEWANQKVKDLFKQVEVTQ